MNLVALSFDDIYIKFRIASEISNQPVASREDQQPPATTCNGFM
jgi:hypothetical protein